PSGSTVVNNGDGTFTFTTPDGSQLTSDIGSNVVISASNVNIYAEPAEEVLFESSQTGTYFISGTLPDGIQVVDTSRTIPVNEAYQPIETASEAFQNLETPEIKRFTQALSNNAPIDQLSGIASKIVAEAFVQKVAEQQSTATTISAMISQAINVGRTIDDVAFLSANILSTYLENDGETELVVKSIVQPLFESELTSEDIAQILSRMIINTESAKQPEVIRAIVLDPNMTEAYIDSLYNILNNINPELAQRLSAEAQLKFSGISRGDLEVEALSGQEGIGLLVRLKEKVIGAHINPGDSQEISYSATEHQYRIASAKAKILSVFREYD
uniref:hypothetical protein n=1 Tax=Facilibium subflavum TaxID=2219058 RepID=UPI0013C2A9E3